MISKFLKFVYKPAGSTQHNIVDFLYFGLKLWLCMSFISHTFKCEKILQTFRNTSFFLKVVDFVSEVAICPTPSETQSVVYGSVGVDLLLAFLKLLTVYNQSQLP